MVNTNTIRVARVGTINEAHVRSSGPAVLSHKQNLATPSPFAGHRIRRRRRRRRVGRAVAAGVKTTMAGALLRSGGARLLFHDRPSTPRLLRLPEQPRTPPPSLLLPFLKQGLSRFSSAPVGPSPPLAKRNGLVSWYLGLLEARPVLTKGATAGFIFTAADVSSQVSYFSIFSELGWLRWDA